MTHNIFISYSRKDIDIVRTIKTEIEQATKVECWMDLDGIVSGKPSFTNAIVDIFVHAFTKLPTVRVCAERIRLCL